MAKNIRLTAEQAAAFFEFKYRQQLKVLIPNIGDPPNHARVAAELFRLVQLPPSEFRKMSAKDRIPFIDQAIKAQVVTEPEKAPEPQPKRVGRPRKGGATVNARMLDELGRNPAAADWTLEQWAERLDCSPKTVFKTKTWKAIVANREASKSHRKSRIRKAYEQ